MKSNRYILLLLMTQAVVSGALAQNKGGIANQEVTVVKEYEATIQDAQKIDIPPNIPEVEETKPNLDYSVPQEEINDFPYEASPLRPIAMSKEKLERYNTSFIKLGLGSQLSPLAQLAYNDDKSKNTRFGFFYDHISMASWTDKLQRFSDDKLGLYVKHYFGPVEVGSSFTFRNYRTHFYGIDTAFYGPDTSFSAKSVLQIFRTYNADVYLKNAEKNKFNLDYEQDFRFNYLQQVEAAGNANEWYFAGTTNIDKTFAKFHTIYGLLNFDVSQLKNDSLVLNRVIVTPAVGYGFNNDDWKGHAQGGVAIDGGHIVFVTDLHLQKSIYKDNFIVFAGFERRYQKNSLDSFLQVNNFIQNWVSIQNSTIDDFNAGLKGTVDNFTYNLSYNLMHVKNMAFFINDTSDVKRFLVVYDPSTWINNFHFETGYNTKEWLRLLLFGDLNLYSTSIQQRPWQDPLFKLTLRANYVLKQKLIFGVDLYALTNSYAYYRLVEGDQKELNGTADVNVDVEYLFNKHLSFFGSLNNILGIRYQIWNDYRSYGINGMVGAKYAF